MKRYKRIFADLNKKGEAAFIPFIMLGDPNPKLCLKIVDTLVSHGADALELGIPFSDPIADGPTIQQAALRALEMKVTPQICFNIIKNIRVSYPDLPIGLLTYSNLVLRNSLDYFYQQAKDSGVDSILVADAPTIEARPFVEAADRCKVAPVLIAPPNIDDQRLDLVAKWSKGYTYVVTRAGVTGENSQFNFTASELLAKLKSFGAPPPILGFGISQPAHVKMAIEFGAAGVISGSAVVSRIEQNLDDLLNMHQVLGDFARSMKSATRFK